MSSLRPKNFTNQHQSFSDSGKYRQARKQLTKQKKSSKHNKTKTQQITKQSNKKV
jgi:hypothetical protein